MFDTEEFRQMLAETLSIAVTSHKLTGYDGAVIDRLQTIAIDVSKESLGDIEASAEQLPREVRSASIIAQTAAVLASETGKRYITCENIDQAIAKHFCTVWPFCISEM